MKEILVKMIRDSYVKSETKDKSMINYTPVYDIVPSDREVIADFIEQQEKFAELGRSAMRIEICWHHYKINDGDCHGERCSRYWFCLKRAEILTEGCDNG